jgi:hypothetical protein
MMAVRETASIGSFICHMGQQSLTYWVIILLQRLEIANRVLPEVIAMVILDYLK